MKPILKQLVAALTLISASAAAEQPTWFEVEVLVFSQNSTSSEQFADDVPPVDTRGGKDLFSEIWLPDLSSLQLALNGCDNQQWIATPEQCQMQQLLAEEPQAPAQLPMMAVAADAGDPSQGKPYLLQAELLQFGDQANQLRRAGSQILLHSGWQMPVYGKRQAQPFHLFGGKNFQDQFNLDGSLKVEQPDPFAQYGWLETSGEEPQQPPVWQLDGLLTIYLNQFLYIDANLGLRQPAERELAVIEEVSTEVIPQVGGVEIYALEDPNAIEVEAETEAYLATIPMKQSRRVRSREIHYFDHPKFGMVIQIRRMEQPNTASTNL
ncbi:peptidoglycan binding protein CsiV [Ferrimonas senticii]|uniref:peptidoglycan binding protein CsiV n=1 Tax=Ferrimonas senticii TaxID=394566 RepID=UPI00041AA858|nr:peptidoglycan binding protein CsiV [Ferrimonas senticii]